MSSYVKEKRALLKGDEDWQHQSLEKLRSFLNDALKKQTRDAHTEGNFRSFEKGDDSILKQFVQNTLYYNVNDTSLNLSKEKLDHIQQICEKIISISKKFSWVDKIYLRCIWIYYFDYEENEQKAIPVFKIYIKEERNVFVDVKLDSYYKWNTYLDNAGFPKSLVCVPRNGEYKFESDRLDVEVFCTKSSQNFKKYRKFISFKWKSFFEACLEKFQLLAHDIKKKIINFAAHLSNYLKKHNISVERSLMFAITLGCELFSGEDPTGSLIPKLQNIALMILNLRPHTDTQDVETQIHKFREVDTSVSQSKDPEESLFTQLCIQARDPKKNWRKIFHIFCDIIRENLPSLIEVEKVIMEICPYKPILLIFKILIAFAELVKYFRDTGSNQKASKCVTSGESLSNPGPTQSGIEKPLERFLTDCDLLELNPGENMHNLIAGEFSRKPIPLGFFEDTALFYLPNASFPEINEISLKFLGSKVTFKPTANKYNVQILKGPEKVVGYIHYVGDFTAFVLVFVEHEKIDEEEMENMWTVAR